MALRPLHPTRVQESVLHLQGHQKLYETKTQTKIQVSLTSLKIGDRVQSKASYANHDSSHNAHTASDMSFLKPLMTRAFCPTKVRCHYQALCIWCNVPFQTWSAFSVEQYKIERLSTRPRAQSHASIPSSRVLLPSNRIVSTPVNTSSPVSHRTAPRHQFDVTKNQRKLDGSSATSAPRSS